MQLHLSVIYKRFSTKGPRLLYSCSALIVFLPVCNLWLWKEQLMKCKLSTPFILIYNGFSAMYVYVCKLAPQWCDTIIMSYGLCLVTTYAAANCSLLTKLCMLCSFVYYTLGLHFMILSVIIMVHNRDRLDSLFNVNDWVLVNS